MIKKLMSYIGEYKRDTLLSPISVTFEVILEVLLPMLMAKVIDNGVEAGNMNYVVKMGLLMLVVAMLSLAAGTLSGVFAARASMGFGKNLRKAMYDNIQDFSFQNIDHFSTAGLVTRMTTDVTNVQNAYQMLIRMFVRAPIMMISALVMCVSISPKISLIFLIALVFLGGVMAFIVSHAFPIFDKMFKGYDKLNASVQENDSAIRVVKAFVREGYERIKFKKSNDELMDAALAVGLRIIAIMPVMMLALNGATVAVLYFGGGMVMGGTFELGDLQAFINYIVQILMSVMMVAMSLLQLSRAQACAHRIKEVLETEPSVENKPEGEICRAALPGEAADGTDHVLPAPRGEVEFRDVSFKYVASGSGDDVLSHISFHVRPGQFVAIVGGTGTGKSTLVNLIPRFYDVTGGQVLLDGVDVRDYPLEELRGRIGMVLQTNILFSGTIRENLLWGNPEATEEEMIQAAKDAQAYDFIMSFPDGFDTGLSQGGVNVSGGQKQRLCIARAMLRKPAVLILDDSTSAVDSATEAAIRESFAANLKETTVIIIAQRISSVQYADEILILEDDHIAARGTHEELLATSPIYQEIYQSQQEGVGE